MNFLKTRQKLFASANPTSVAMLVIEERFSLKQRQAIFTLCRFNTLWNVSSTIALNILQKWLLLYPDNAHTASKVIGLE